MENANYQNILSASMSLMRRLPPGSTVKNLAAICSLIKDDEMRDDVQVKSDQPLGKLNFNTSSNQIINVFQKLHKMMLMEESILNANTTKTVTHSEAHFLINTSQLLSQMPKTQTTSQSSRPKIYWKWKLKQMKCFINMQSCIMTMISGPQSTFSILIQTDLVAAGWLKRVSDNLDYLY